MILNLKVENFYSINAPQELDFTSNRLYSDSYAQCNDKYVNLVNCFVGANASGKTNILKALAFLLWFAEDSYKTIDKVSGALFVPHKLRGKDTSKFELVFDVNNQIYKYSLELTWDKVISEVFAEKSQKGFSFLYKLTNENGVINIKYNRNNKSLTKINKEDEKRFKGMTKISFLSFLINTGYLSELKLHGITKQTFSNVFHSGSRSLDQFTESIMLSKGLKNQQMRSRLLPIIRNFDFGIDDFAKDEMFKLTFPDGNNINLIGFKHSNQGKKFYVSALEESAGTIKGTYLLMGLLGVLEKGGIAIIDEFDARLHYDIARKIISLFVDKETNPKNAQLFFTTHQPLFLNDRDKTQIFLCYKEDYLNSEIYRLDDIENIRNTENFFEKYLSGEYGATPRIGDCM